ncbi:hypothetical protein [Saccharothrix algeriensis]|uniref:Secreted protein n=1 Tax=Saccharothrix algeriensis TaxID=173560 RepID=A0ABS2S3S1_9PSEU|nr:hypothetical protein [Saccharothrix algeriensis]MBM7810888.1 hypothetical protein [Saccharothrix algeriensis]
MARAVVTAVLLALVAVLTPAQSGPGHVGALAAPAQRAPAPLPGEGLSEEEPGRESRKGPELRAFSAVARAAGRHHRMGLAERAALRRAAPRLPEPARLDAATDHLHTRLTPSTLQVFRN